MNNLFRKLTRWVRQLPQAPRLQRSIVVVAIEESHAVLCETCHHVVRMSGYIVALSGPGNTCPQCEEKDPSKLKWIAAWIRTEGEQREHWAGRTRKGFVKALSGGEPKRMPQQVVRFIRPPDAA